jgi:hypothetical protein
VYVRRLSCNECGLSRRSVIRRRRRLFTRIGQLAARAQLPRSAALILFGQRPTVNGSRVSGFEDDLWPLLRLGEQFYEQTAKSGHFQWLKVSSSQPLVGYHPLVNVVLIALLGRFRVKFVLICLL